MKWGLRWICKCLKGRAVIQRLRRENQLLRQERDDILAFTKHRQRLEFEKRLALRTQLKALRDVADRDPLTELYNRRGMEAHFREMRSIFLRLRRDEPTRYFPMTAIRFDLDNFKPINDSHGHREGDRVLIAFADCLHRVFQRGSDILVREGGDEFVVIMPYVDTQHALGLCERFSLYLEQDPRFFFENARVTASMGVANISYEKEDGLSKALEAADRAATQAKRSGKNTARLVA